MTYHISYGASDGLDYYNKSNTKPIASHEKKVKNTSSCMKKDVSV